MGGGGPQSRLDLLEQLTLSEARQLMEVLLSSELAGSAGAADSVRGPAADGGPPVLRAGWICWSS